MYLIHIHIEAVHDSVLLLLLLLSGMEPARRNSSKKNVRAKELGVFDLRLISPLLLLPRSLWLASVSFRNLSRPLFKMVLKSLEEF